MVPRTKKTTVTKENTTEEILNKKTPLEIIDTKTKSIEDEIKPSLNKLNPKFKKLTKDIKENKKETFQDEKLSSVVVLPAKNIFVKKVNKITKDLGNSEIKVENHIKIKEEELPKQQISTSIKELETKSLAELRNIASDNFVNNFSELNQKDLIMNILSAQTKRGGNIFAEGFLELIKDNHGVLRSLSMLPGENDVYVSNSQIKRFNLRPGDFIIGQARPPKEGERYLGLLKIEAINNQSPEKAISRVHFNSLVPIYPDQQIKLETSQHKLSTRIIDLVSPVGKGQRGLIVAPPKVGKTTMLKEIAEGITTNHPEIHLMVVLVGERPEEVTDMQRSIKGEVIAANFDEHPDNQTKISEMAVERAKRLVELGMDVVILMDSITRLARAYNIIAPASGRTLSGGFDPVAILPPKKFFGAARNMEHGGSLTIIATALVDTGSKMDEVIFEEFKGTGNMELKLDRKLAERRIFPSIEVSASSTRHENLLLGEETLAQTWRVIRMLDTIKTESNLNPTDILIERLKKTKSNQEFLGTLHESF